MRFLSFFSAASFFILLGCSSVNELAVASEAPRAVNDANLDVYRPVDGTKTSIVGLPLNKDGSPKESITKIKIYAYPGGRIVLAGPEQFSIYFKKKKFPGGVIRESSKDGVVVVKIPENIFQLPEFKEEYKNKKSITFDFGVITGGKDIDPQIVIIRQH
jgi:hypothetical protein